MVISGNKRAWGFKKKVWLSRLFLSIQGLYMRHLSYKMSNNKIKQLTPEAIEKHFPLANTAQATICNLVVMNCLKEQIKTLEKSH